MNVVDRLKSFLEIEARSCSMDFGCVTPLYVYRMLGGAAGVIHQVESATTDCQPNENVEALRVFMLGKKIEACPTWKPMHKQPVYAGAPVYTNGIEEELFKVGFWLPAGPYVTDEDVRYIVESIREAIVG